MKKVHIIIVVVITCLALAGYFTIARGGGINGYWVAEHSYYYMWGMAPQRAIFEFSGNKFTFWITPRDKKALEKKGGGTFVLKDNKIEFKNEDGSIETVDFSRTENTIKIGSDTYTRFRE